ncbi:hypothetical protein IQ226_04485 [Dolichospermum sp. LEGE 00240]|uniref:hypothetical protein n=1 Tax=Dolichospermum sp. LEGE 00240 TaxID=1828603 RepID=UPI0018813C68|nr:hypothetical protein [Dolichospermum sp. LEGE 00240]MBE9248461.1 hypothetical protein [Dolichospermum sp. LEGE 00240]MDM3851937.1 hypothetical protein [Aphanizomenon gracile PMC627.10]
MGMGMCDSEALRRNRSLGMLGVRSLFGDVGVMRSLFGGVGMRSLLGMCGMRSLLGMWGAIAFGGVKVRSLFRRVTVDYLLT